MSVTFSLKPPAPSAERITSRPPVSGTSPISDTSASLRKSSSAKAGGGSGAAAFSVVVSVMRPGSTTWRAISSARKRLVSSGAAPASVTLSPSVSTRAQSCPAASSALASWVAVADSNQLVAASASFQAAAPAAANTTTAKRMARSRMTSPVPVAVLGRSRRRIKAIAGHRIAAASSPAVRISPASRFERKSTRHRALSSMSSRRSCQ